MPCGAGQSRSGQRGGGASERDDHGRADRCREMRGTGVVRNQDVAVRERRREFGKRGFAREIMVVKRARSGFAGDFNGEILRDFVDDPQIAGASEENEATSPTVVKDSNDFPKICGRPTFRGTKFRASVDADDGFGVVFRKSEF